MTTRQRPCVLVIAGHDPTGGAGVQADIETLLAHGVRPVTLITALTAQDTHGVRHIRPQAADDLRAQARLLLDDIPVDAVKIGVLGDSTLVQVVTEILGRLHVPVILDPVLASGGGQTLADSVLTAWVTEALLPLATVATPNILEACHLAGRDLQAAREPDLLGADLLARGAGAILLTGTHAESIEVVNRLYQPGEPPIAWAWPRLTAEYHGSGCTLASSVAAGLALGRTLEQAVAEAQAYTWEALAAGAAVGRGQWLPTRFPVASGVPVARRP
ncbi:MAG TPA: hydroxymethylpyrimidine/phosphomethylpyrimidine kinase [Gammaproteobacteria bacterium]|nr:hydroxymethylpyrimidine/phosphomethylpyrimidine kinase [Gammaproteobacteria bacterium]